MRTWMVVGACLGLLLTACGDGSSAQRSTEPDGPQVRVRGVVSDGAICPGGRRPCLPFAGEIEPDGADRAVVTGRLSDGRLHVVAQEPSPPDRFRRGDECGPEVVADDSEPVREALAGYIDSIPDAVAANWVSSSGTLHLGVVDEAGPHLMALMEADLAGAVCVVGGFERSRQELDEVMAEVVEHLLALEQDGVIRFFGGFPDPDLGAVVLDVDRIDAPFAAEIAERFGDAVRLRAPYEVLDGSFDDLDAALAEVVPSSDVGLVVTCGDVRFERLPPDPDDFAELDDDARSALDGLGAGPAGDETRFFERFDWRLGERTQERLLLLGVPHEGAEGFGSAAFRRVDDAWVVEAFGSCRVQVSAVGLEPAEVRLDPEREPDPSEDELPVLINEQACANGEPPVGREIVPVVVETETTIELVVLVAPVAGGAACPSNPWHPITVPLDGPLGERMVLDGSTQPPVERIWSTTDPEAG